MNTSSWTIFPNTILSHLEFLDCDDTIDGICHSTKNLSECINLCKNDKIGSCRTGYFIEMDNGDTICAPLREYEKEQTNPYYRLRDKSIYPVLNKAKTFVFSNYTYPPGLTNSLFYLDNFVLKNINTGMYVGINENSLEIEFTMTSPSHFRFLEQQIKQASVENYIYIRNGDNVVLNIPSTSLILSRNVNKNTLDITTGVDLTNNEDNVLSIFAVDKKNGDILNYEDKFYFMYKNQVVEYNVEAKALNTINVDINDAIHSGYNVLFSLTPKIQVYYCDNNNNCSPIPLEETDRVNTTATYKGQTVHRSSRCWNQCAKKNRSEKVLILLIIIFLLFIVFLFKH